jgi:hypothetical protein
MFGIWPRPNYAFGVYHAADLACRLELPRMSVIEFGVAGGRGLLELERLADEVGRHFGVDISVFGFDTGQGMPEPEDYRDLPYYWDAGFYRMDPPKLQARLKRAKLMLGDVGDTVPSLDCPPIGFISFDLDYYSSTKRAFRVFDLPAEKRMPRVSCYFDNIMSLIGCYNEYIGELCAIREFNDENEYRKICPLNGLEWMTLRTADWQKRFYVQHDFKHPLYCKRITVKNEGSKLTL